MSRLARASALTLFLFAAFLAPVGARGQAAPLGDVVFLTSSEPDHVDEKDRPAPFLARELVRQAFLIAARDECGLLTRDTTLREELPAAADPRSRAFLLFCSVSKGKESSVFHYALSRLKGATREELWKWGFPADVDGPEMIANLAERAEGLSRGELKAALRRNGAGKPVPPARASAAVPQEAKEQLWEFNEIAVLGALRRIHAEIRAKGESPELLAALAVGYANLGTLTKFYYSPAHKAFSARALLYAERLIGKTKGSAWALWHRAYVRTVVGPHHLAELDIAAAKERQVKSPSPQPLPFWTGILGAFAEGHIPQMLQQATTTRQLRLARYLALEAVVYSKLDNLMVKTAQSVLEQCPDCPRAADAMCSSRQLGVMQAVTSGAFQRLSKSLRTRLPKIPSFSGTLAKRLGEKVEDEVDFRVQLVADLKAESASGRDTTEPSLAVLGQMIEEIEFAQLVRRVQLEGTVWGISTDETIATFRPLCEHHRYVALIDTFGKRPPEVRKAVAALAERIDPSEAGYIEALALQRLRRYDETHIAAWLQIAYSHADPVFGDEMLGLDAGAAGARTNQKSNEPYMKLLWSTSSKLPAAVAVRIARDWRHARPEAAATEKEFANDPLVIAALLHKYVELEQFDDAVRCAKRAIEIAPDYGTYRTLANIYKQQGDMVRWKETLEKSLELPSLGLEEYQVRNIIARYHMDRREWKEAVVYADAAAASYAAWAMLTAARCHEMLGEWNKSEALMRATSERYDGSAFEWMLWCHRTGHGDAQSAEECARKQFESLGNQAAPRALERIGAYYLLRKEPEKALVVFSGAYEKGRSAYSAMHAASVADTLGKSAERDEYLTKIVNAAKNQDPTSIAGVYGRLAQLMQQALPPGSMQDFDFKQVDSIIQAAVGSPRPGDTNLAYFVGVFLQNRGAADKSRDYLIRCAQTSNYRRHTYALACQLLRDLKIPVPAPNGPEVNEDGDDASGSAQPINRDGASRRAGRRRR